MRVIKEGADDYARRSDLQYHFMDRHDILGKDLVRIVGELGVRAVSISGKVYPKMTVSQVREVIAQQYLIVEKEKEGARV